MQEQKQCCQDKENIKTKWVLNRFEEWEVLFTYCSQCGEILEENNINRSC